MKGIKIVYWISTGLFSLIMLVIASGYLASGQLKAAFNNFGFPEYFRSELAVAKFVGVIGLLLQMVKGRVKEWIYASFAVTLCSGFIAHYAVVGHAAGSLILQLIMLAILIVSYITYRRLNLPMKIREIKYPTAMRPNTRQIMRMLKELRRV